MSPAYAYDRPCGALVNAGKTCGTRIRMPARVCDDCRDAIIAEYVATEEGRANAAESFTRREIAIARSDIARKERERKEAEATARRSAALAARNHPGLVVYYAQLGANHIKIGTTLDLPRRMAELRVVNASNLLAAEPGGYDVEQRRHQQFRKWRYQKRKEDFGEGPDLIDHIRAVRAQHGDPYALAAQMAARTTSGVPCQVPPT